MPPTNREIVQANSDAFSRRDVESMLELFAPDAAVVDRRAVGFGEFRGHEAVRSYYEGVFDNVDELYEDIERFSEDGDVVIASCNLTLKLAGQEEFGEITLRYALRVTLAGGLIQALDIYDDARSAAAGE